MNATDTQCTSQRLKTFPKNQYLKPVSLGKTVKALTVFSLV